MTSGQLKWCNFALHYKPFINLPMHITRTTSADLFEQAKIVFPGGVSSPVRAFKSVDGPPLFMVKGSGSRITDADGNTFIDFCASWGPLILGHCHPAVQDAIVDAVHHGTSFGTPSLPELHLGQLMVQHNRFIDKVRFVSSGTEAVMSAIRLARGATGKNKIIKFEGCYHGHVDSLLVKAGSGLVTFGVGTSAGVPASFASETIVLPLNDREALEKTLEAHGHDVAAVIIEPIPANNGLLIQDVSFLHFLRDITRQYGVLLLFDEVISGFRVGLEGAAGLYGIAPDIVTYGKIIGGGMPVGAYGGSHALMSHISPEGPVYQAGTLSGNPVAMAAGLATLRELIKPGFYESLEEKTNLLVEPIRRHADKHGYPLTIPQVGSIFWMVFSRDAVRTADQIDADSMQYFRKLHAGLLDRGVYLGPSGYEVGFVSAAHSVTDLEQAAEAFCDTLDEVFLPA